MSDVECSVLNIKMKVGKNIKITILVGEEEFKVSCKVDKINTSTINRAVALAQLIIKSHTEENDS